MKYCPNCSSKKIKYDGIKKYSCPECGLVFYQNTAAAAGGLLEYNGKILVVVRNREPGKGKLDFPGGFVDPMESAEQALRREVREELGVEIDNLHYLCSAPNIYKYKGIEYNTCDLFFTGKFVDVDFRVEEAELAGFVWLNKEELDADKFAFMSMKTAIEHYKKLSPAI